MRKCYLFLMMLFVQLITLSVFAQTDAEYNAALESITDGGVYFIKTDYEGDYYYFNEDNYELVGERTGKRYVLGQTVKVRVNAVDMAMRAVDFVLDE